MMIDETSTDPLSIFSRGMVADDVCQNGDVNFCRKHVYSTLDYANLRAMGFTYMRVPIDVCSILPGLPLSWAPGSLSTTATVAASLAYVDTTIAAMVAAGLAVMPCVFVDGDGAPNLRDTLGAAPGAYGQSTFEDMLLGANLMLVSRWCGLYPPERIAFELYNEPRYDGTAPYKMPALWNAAAATITAAVRALAPLHTVVVDTPHFAKPQFAFNMVPTGDDNTIYSLHFYDPPFLTNAGAGSQFDPNYAYPRESTPGATFQTIQGPAPALHLPDSQIDAVAWLIGTALTGRGQKVANLYDSTGVLQLHQPTDYFKTQSAKADLLATIMKGVAWAQGTGGGVRTGPVLKIIFGEIGLTSLGDKQSRINWLRDVRDILESTGVPGGQATIPWEYWAFLGRLFGLRPNNPDPRGTNVIITEGNFAGYDANLVAGLTTPRGDITAR